MFIIIYMYHLSSIACGFDLFCVAFDMVPFVRVILGTMLPMLGMAKQDNMKWVFSSGDRLVLLQAHDKKYLFILKRRCILDQHVYGYMLFIFSLVQVL